MYENIVMIKKSNTVFVFGVSTILFCIMVLILDGNSEIGAQV